MKKKSGFEKFQKVKKGSVLKEQIRQEKKKETKERKAYFENKRKEKATAGETPPGMKVQKAIARPAVAGEMPLNKYLAHSGVCSRRDAAEVVKTGKVKVNGTVVLEPGHKVTIKDDITVGGKKIQPTKDLVYILL